MPEAMLLNITSFKKWTTAKPHNKLTRMTKIKTMTKPSTVKNGKQKLNSTDKKAK